MSLGMIACMWSGAKTSCETAARLTANRQSKKGGMMSLASTLDGVAEAGGREAATRAAAHVLTPQEYRKMAVAHVAGLLRLVPEGVSGAGVRFGNILVHISEPGREGQIFYEDVGSGFTVHGVTLSHSDGPPKLEGLIYLLHYARDRIDGLLMLPYAMREQRIAQLVDAVGASEEFVRFMLKNYPVIERALEA